MCLYLNILLERDISGNQTTKRYDKYDGFPYLCSNITSSHAYGVFVSQFIRYVKACSTYKQFLGEASY